MKNRTTAEILSENIRALLDTHTSIDTQLKLASKSGIGQSSIGRVLKAKNQATASTVDAIAEAFGVTSAQLLPLWPASTTHTLFQ